MLHGRPSSGPRTLSSSTSKLKNRYKIRKRALATWFLISGTSSAAAATNNVALRAGCALPVVRVRGDAQFSVNLRIPGANVLICDECDEKQRPSSNYDHTSSHPLVRFYGQITLVEDKDS